MRRGMHDAQHRAVIFQQGHTDRPIRQARHEGARAIDGIDHPDMATAEPDMIIGGLFRQPGGIRHQLGQADLQECINGDIGFGHR